MRILFLSTSAFLTVGAIEPQNKNDEQISSDGATFAIEDIQSVMPENCQDRIHYVRQERGLPELDDAPATPDGALLIAAVDHQVDGCNVLVMQEDTADVRPLPKFDDKTVKLIPAN